MKQESIPLSSDWVGLQTEAQTFTVSFRDISNFAASLSDTNSIYYASGKAHAHPVFPVTLSWKTLTKKITPGPNVFLKR